MDYYAMVCRSKIVRRHIQKARERSKRSTSALQSSSVLAVMLGPRAQSQPTTSRNATAFCPVLCI